MNPLPRAVSVPLESEIAISTTASVLRFTTSATVSWERADDLAVTRREKKTNQLTRIFTARLQCEENTIYPGHPLHFKTTNDEL